MKRIIKRMLPFFIIKKAREFTLFLNYIYDFKRYKAYVAFTNKKLNDKQLISKIIMTYHVIEKGLTLKETRLGFGKSRIKLLINYLLEYKREGYNINSIHYKSAVSVLFEYVDYHEEKKYDVSWLTEILKQFKDSKDNSVKNTLLVNKSDILKGSQSSFEDFAFSRHSIRNYSSKDVDLELVYKAVKLAQKSPSVCNRQSSRVYIVNDEKAKNIIRKIQNGNRGFGEFADKFLIVTTDLCSFDYANERNQGFIDGGMYSMSLLYGLHYVGIAACTINWSVDKSTDLKFRKLININKSENILLIIAIGNYPDEFILAKSNRELPENIYKVI